MVVGERSWIGIAVGEGVIMIFGVAVGSEVAFEADETPVTGVGVEVGVGMGVVVGCEGAVGVAADELLKRKHCRHMSLCKLCR